MGTSVDPAAGRSSSTSGTKMEWRWLAASISIVCAQFAYYLHTTREAGGSMDMASLYNTFPSHAVLYPRYLIDIGALWWRWSIVDEYAVTTVSYDTVTHRLSMGFVLTTLLS